MHAAAPSSSVLLGRLHPGRRVEQPRRPAVTLKGLPVVCLIGVGVTDGEATRAGFRGGGVGGRDRRHGDGRGRAARADGHDPRVLTSEDANGLLRTVSVDGPIDLDNPFFQSLGTNGRRCVSCHQPDNAWGITPANVQARFASSHGTDPIFTNNDGSNCEGAVPQTLAGKRAAYSLLLTRGLIRVGARRAADGRIRHRAHRRSEPLRSGHQRRLALSPAAAVDEPALPQRCDVGRPGVVGDDHHRAGSAAPGQ